MDLSSNEQLLLQNKYSNKAQWDIELANMEKQMSILMEATTILKKHNELQMINNAIAVDPKNYVLLKPTWKFEEDPEYIKNHREITLINHRLKAMEFDGIIKQRELDYSNIEKQYNDLLESHKKLCTEIAELENRNGDE